MAKSKYEIGETKGLYSTHFNVKVQNNGKGEPWYGFNVSYNGNPNYLDNETLALQFARGEYTGDLFNDLPKKRQEELRHILKNARKKGWI